MVIYLKAAAGERVGGTCVTDIKVALAVKRRRFTVLEVGSCSAGNALGDPVRVVDRESDNVCVCEIRAKQAIAGVKRAAGRYAACGCSVIDGLDVSIDRILGRGICAVKDLVAVISRRYENIANRPIHGTLREGNCR